MQRRRKFRINTKISKPVEVTFTLPNEEEVTLTAGNISGGGLCLRDVEHVLECEPRQLLAGCRIQIPDVEPFLIDLEVRHFYEKTKKNGTSVHYVGCEFKNMRANHEHDIQHYINALQLEG